MANVLYFFDDVIIKLELLKSSKRFQILYFPDIEKRKRKDFDFAKVNNFFRNDFILIKIISDGFCENGFIDNSGINHLFFLFISIS